MTNSFFGFTSSVMKGSMKARSPTTPWAWASTAVIAQRNPPTALARHRIMYPSRPAAQRRDPSMVGRLAVLRQPGRFAGWRGHEERAQRLGPRERRPTNERRRNAKADGHHPPQ